MFYVFLALFILWLLPPTRYLVNLPLLFVMAGLSLAMKLMEPTRTTNGPF